MEMGYKDDPLVIFAPSPDPTERIIEMSQVDNIDHDSTHVQHLDGKLNIYILDY